MSIISQLNCKNKEGVVNTRSRPRIFYVFILSFNFPFGLQVCMEEASKYKITHCPSAHLRTFQRLSGDERKQVQQEYPAQLLPCRHVGSRDNIKSVLDKILIKNFNYSQNNWLLVRDELLICHLTQIFPFKQLFLSHFFKKVCERKYCGT